MISLPIGRYSLVFLMDSMHLSRGSFALDNIAITSCSYPSSTLTPYDALLSFSCNFDNASTCGLVNGNSFSTPTYNFTLVTGDTVPNRQLGPTRDHTNNASSGGFIHWNQQLPFTSKDTGVVNPVKPIQQNLGMCIRFAYYVKSLGTSRNGTHLSLATAGCYATYLWTKSMDDSEGWQVVTIPVLGYPCAETLSPSVVQVEPVPVSVAFDDIEIAQCSTFDPPTTSTITTSTTSTISSKTTTLSTTSSTMTTTKISTQTTNSTTTTITTSAFTITETSTSTTSSSVSTTSSRSCAFFSVNFKQLFISSFLFLSMMK
jgi:hypothetical protein